MTKLTYSQELLQRGIKNLKEEVKKLNELFDEGSNIPDQMTDQMTDSMSVFYALSEVDAAVSTLADKAKEQGVPTE